MQHFSQTKNLISMDSMFTNDQFMWPYNTFSERNSAITSPVCPSTISSQIQSINKLLLAHHNQRDYIRRHIVTLYQFTVDVLLCDIQAIGGNDKKFYAISDNDKKLIVR